MKQPCLHNMKVVQAARQLLTVLRLMLQDIQIPSAALCPLHTLFLSQGTPKPHHASLLIPVRPTF